MAIQNITNGWQNIVTANNTATIPVTNIPTSVNSVLITFTNLTVTALAFPLVQISTNNGSSYIASGYESGLVYFAYNGTSPSNQNSTTGFQFTFQMPPGASSNGNLYIYGINLPVYSMSTGSTTYYPGSGNSLFGITGGNLNGTTGVNSFQLLMSTGNITTGTFKIYGLN